MYQIRKVTYHDIEISPDDLISLAEAAVTAGVHQASIVRIAQLDNSPFRTVIDTSRPKFRGQMFLYRSDFTNWLKSRKARTPTGGGISHSTATPGA